MTHGDDNGLVLPPNSSSNSSNVNCTCIYSNQENSELELINKVVNKISC